MPLHNDNNEPTRKEVEYMKTFDVRWEVLKRAIVKAKNEEEAIEKVMDSDVDSEEIEITSPPEAFEEEA